MFQPDKKWGIFNLDEPATIPPRNAIPYAVCFAPTRGQAITIAVNRYKRHPMFDKKYITVAHLRETYHGPPTKRHRHFQAFTQSSENR